MAKIGQKLNFAKMSKNFGASRHFWSKFGPILTLVKAVSTLKVTVKAKMTHPRTKYACVLTFSTLTPPGRRLNSGTNEV